MAEFIFSLDADWLDTAQPAGAEGAPGVAAASPRPVSGRWRDSEGQPVGEPFPIQVSRGGSVEYVSGNGSFASASLAPAISFETEAQPAASSLEVLVGGHPAHVVSAFSLKKAASSLPPPQTFIVGPGDATLVVPVFAERFQDLARFRALVADLRSWVLQHAPFDENAIGARLAFKAHFWASDRTRGLFDTLDSAIIDGRLFHGDRERAKKLLRPWTEDGPGISLILIDSSFRGGAGGQPGYSAWASVAAAPGEEWQAIGLHEIGHGLGLADEYVDDARKDERPARLEPNISDDPVPSRAPWGLVATVGDAPAPTVGLTGSAPGVIGTFQGARYRRDLYRSSQECLMLHTRAQFCKVCQDHIRSRLAGD